MHVPEYHHLLSIYFNMAPTTLSDIQPPVAIPTKSAPAGRVENPPQLQVLGKTKSGKTLKIRSYPRFDNLEDERIYRKQHLAAAFRIFADRGFDEGVAGHISVRDPILTDHFCRLFYLSVPCLKVY
jgi:glucose-6-phosphate 1-epimerase